MQNSSNLGLVQIFWGNGKGKTTSALGAALRALGNGFSVHLVQFMKNSNENPEFSFPGELNSLKNLKNFSYKRFGAPNWFFGKANEEHILEARKAYEYLFSCFGKYDLLIADEILYALQFNLLKEEDVINLIKQKPKNQELILTGSHVPFYSIFKLADLVTEIKKYKHPFDSGILARKGIEY